MNPPPLIRELQSLDVREDGRALYGWGLSFDGELLLWELNVTQPPGQMQTLRAVECD